MSSIDYPVRVDASLEPGLSRWLWLFKWLLALPHYVVLFFLWVAFAVLSVCAFVAILVTGRYPRGIFDFNVGVLRWTWRVTFYAYGGLATDHYPPFTLDDVPEYPAHFDVAYPERLSRGLVLVKWWLLAIPHYLVVAVFLGGGWYASADHQPPLASLGLIGLLVLVAAIMLLFTGRYPQSIFDIVLGLQRWVLRVAAYVALMTDDYPPFRLDMGGPDPGGTSITVRQVSPDAPTPGPEPDPGATPASLPGPTSTRPAGSWSSGRVVAVVLAVLLFLLGGGIATAGGTLFVADQIARDSTGFLMSPATTLDSSGAALVSEDLRLDSGTASSLPERLLGDGKLRVEPAHGDTVFVGVARSRDAAAYLRGVAYSIVTDPGGGDVSPTYRQHPGGAPAVAPNEAGIWVASAQGTGRQSVTWPLRDGSWTLVVMNADGRYGVSGDVAVGAEVPAIVPVEVALLVTGGLLLIAGVVTLLLAVRRPAR